MNQDTRRVLLLAGCFLVAVLGALSVHTNALRLAIGGLALLAVLLVFRQTKNADAAAEVKEEKPAKAEKPAKPARTSFKRSPSKAQLRLNALEERLKAQEELVSQLSNKLAHHDGLRRAMWETVDGRLTAVETTQTGELAALRDARQRHQLNVVKLQQSVEAHARELTALSEALPAPGEAPAAPSQPASVASSF
jgi:hypothetical protein